MISVSPKTYKLIGAVLIGANAAAQALGANAEWAQLAMWASMIIGLAMKIEDTVVKVDDAAAK